MSQYAIQLNSVKKPKLLRAFMDCLALNIVLLIRIFVIPRNVKENHNSRLGYIFPNFSFDKCDKDRSSNRK